MRQPFGFSRLLAAMLVIAASSANIHAEEKPTKPQPRSPVTPASAPKNVTQTAPKAAVKKPSSESKPTGKSKQGKSGRDGQRKNRAQGRYQMLKSGDAVIVLDTQTGETRVVETDSDPALQRVDVGRAWVVVTVIGNASPTHRELVTPQSAATKSSKSEASMR